MKSYYNDKKNPQKTSDIWSDLGNGSGQEVFNIQVESIKIYSMIHVVYDRLMHMTQGHTYTAIRLLLSVLSKKSRFCV